MPSYIWVLDRTQTFDTDVRSTWATEINNGGVITLSDRSAFGEMRASSSGYNSSMRPNGATYKTEIRIEMDVRVVGGAQLLGVALWPLSGGSSMFTINNYGAISGASVPTSLYRVASSAPEFSSPPIVSGTAVHALPVWDGVHTFALEVFDNPEINGKSYRAYVDGMLSLSHDDATNPMSEKFIGGVLLRQIDVDFLEYREYHREPAAATVDVETVIAGTPDVPTSAVVKAFNVSNDALEAQVTSDGVSGIASFTTLRSGQSYYFVARLMDDSYGPEAFGPVVVY